MASCPTQTLEEAVDRVVEIAARGMDAAEVKLALNNVAQDHDMVPTEIMKVIRHRDERDEYGPLIIASMGSANRAILGMM